MVVEIDGYKVFIASPGGLEEERKVFVRTLDDYNETDALHRGKLFIPKGWEVTLAGRGRPQSLINKACLSGCHTRPLDVVDRDFAA